jgi:hypothetical protein
MGKACNTHGEMRTAYKILVGKPEEKSPVARLTHRWGDDIKKDIK